MVYRLSWLSVITNVKWFQQKETVFLVLIYADSFKRFAKIITLTLASAVHSTCLVPWYCVAVCSLSFILHLMSWPTVSRFACANIKKKTNVISKYDISNQALCFWGWILTRKRKIIQKQRLVYAFTCLF